jgi:hypothetical protein
MAESALKIPGDLDPDTKKSVLEYRRCVLLEMVGSTPSTNPQLNLILSNGALVTVKSWLGDIVNGTFGTFCSEFPVALADVLVPRMHSLITSLLTLALLQEVSICCCIY